MLLQARGIVHAYAAKRALDGVDFTLRTGHSIRPASSWWTRIVVGILLFLFCVAQRLIEGGTEKRK